MILHVREAEYRQGYVIKLRFNDGAQGEVDLANELSGEFFEPLKDIEAFKNFRVDPNLETIVWNNGAYLAPDFLYGKMKVYN